MPPPPHLTAAQLAKQAERKAAKLARKAASGAANSVPSAEELEKRRIIKREWMNLGPSSEGKRTAQIVTWNVSCSATG
jgi:RNA exonuclease NGL2